MPTRLATSAADVAAQSRHYAALIALTKCLHAPNAPADSFPVLRECIREALPAHGFVAALSDHRSELAIVHREGDAEGCERFAHSALDRLRAGESVLGVEDGRVYLAVPLLHDERLLGCFVADRASADGFSEADGAFLAAAGTLAAVAIDAARSSLLARRLGEETQRLEAVARELHTTLDLETTGQRVADLAHDLVAKPVAVWLVEKDRARAVARAGGALVSLGEERGLTPAEIGRIQQSAEMLRAALDAPDAEERLASFIAANAPDAGLAGATGSAAATGPAGIPLPGRTSIPLVLGERLVGFLAVGPWMSDPVDHDKVRLLVRMAPYAASAVENARLHDELLQTSLTDPLVHLPNRRRFDIDLEKEFAAACRGRQISLVLFDLDRFKLYNNTFGRLAGDEALIRFAQILRGETRSMNLAARFGGEEFAAILSATGLEGARIYADRIRLRVAEKSGGRLTVSAGIAEYRPWMRTPADLVAAADQALYRAKSAGRNQIDAAED